MLRFYNELINLHFIQENEIFKCISNDVFIVDRNFVTVGRQQKPPPQLE